MLVYCLHVYSGPVPLWVYSPLSSIFLKTVTKRYILRKTTSFNNLLPLTLKVILTPSLLLFLFRFSSFFSSSSSVSLTPSPEQNEIHVINISFYFILPIPYVVVKKGCSFLSSLMLLKKISYTNNRDYLRFQLFVRLPKVKMCPRCGEV